ncbi:hypothetical protein LTS18_011529, partial [Coniosporium uncinatum]
MPPSQLTSIGSESTSRTPQVASTSIVEPTDRPPLRKSISLVDTHSSQQNLRPSFEAEVAKLAALPDFEGDGGVEAALLKLEGRLDVMNTAAPVVEPHEQYGSEDEAKHHHREDQFPEDHLPSTPSKSGKKPDVYQPTGGPTPEKAASRRRGPPPPSIAFSEDSYNSVPLLERGLSGRPTTRRGGSIAGPEKITEQVTPRSARFPVQHATGKPAPPVSPVSSVEHVEKTESLRRIPPGESAPRSPILHESFLIEDENDLSERSEGSYRLVGPSALDEASKNVRSSAATERIEDYGREEFTHPLRHPPTPPVARGFESKISVHGTHIEGGLLTPSLTPTLKTPPQQYFAATPTPKEPKRVELSEKADRAATPPQHLPFILTCEAEVLAQQFTIIEKD